KRIARFASDAFISEPDKQVDAAGDVPGRDKQLCLPRTRRPEQRQRFKKYRSKSSRLQRAFDGPGVIAHGAIDVAIVMLRQRPEKVEQRRKEIRTSAPVLGQIRAALQPCEGSDRVAGLRTEAGVDAGK